MFYYFVAVLVFCYRIQSRRCRNEQSLTKYKKKKKEKQIEKNVNNIKDFK